MVDPILTALQAYQRAVEAGCAKGALIDCYAQAENAIYALGAATPSPDQLRHIEQKAVEGAAWRLAMLRVCLNKFATMPDPREWENWSPQQAADWAMDPKVRTAGVMAVDPTGGWCGTKEQAHAIFGPLADRAEYEKLPSINDPEPPPPLADHLGVAPSQAPSYSDEFSSMGGDPLGVKAQCRECAIQPCDTCPDGAPASAEAQSITVPRKLLVDAKKGLSTASGSFARGVWCDLRDAIDGVPVPDGEVVPPNPPTKR